MNTIKIMNTIKNYIMEQGYKPTIADIRKIFKLSFECLMQFGGANDNFRANYIIDHWNDNKDGETTIIGNTEDIKYLKKALYQK